jgi:hypothetical protein
MNIEREEHAWHEDLASLRRGDAVWPLEQLLMFLDSVYL